MKITKVSIAISALAFIVAVVNLVYSIKYSDKIPTAITILCATVAILAINVAMLIYSNKEEKREALEKAAAEAAIPVNDNKEV